MRPAGSALIAFLLSGQNFYSADLFEVIVPSTSTTYYWTSSDQPITVSGVTYVAMGPALSRSRWTAKNTPDVVQMDVKLLSTGTDFTGGTNIKQLIFDGLLDGATINMSRVFMPTFGDTSLGAVLLFGGRVSTITIHALGADITVKGQTDLLQQYMPRNTYQLTCIHTLYNAGCTLNRTSFTFSGVVGAGSSAGVVNWGTARTTDGARFALGYVTMTSGAANATTRTVEAANNTGMVLSYPLYAAPSVGDTFNATYGCQRNITNCNLFDNIQHYRGFPFIPPAETAY